MTEEKRTVACITGLHDLCRIVTRHWTCECQCHSNTVIHKH